MTKPNLILKYKDPAQFCLQIKQDLESYIEDDIKILRKWLFINQGWRLTYKGMLFLNKHYVAYTSQHTANEILSGHILLNMDKCVDGPWYINGTKFIVFNPTNHFELEMVDGNARAYVDFKSIT